MFPKNFLVVGVLAVLITTLQLPTQAVAFEKIVTYQTHHNVDNDLNLANDLEATKYLLSEYTDESFQQAYEVYSKGGYASPSVTVKLQTPLRFHLDEGTVLSATSLKGDMVQAQTVQRHELGETQLELHYDVGVKCHVGGLVEPEDDDCFQYTGHLHVPGHDSTLYYVESTNFNHRTLQELSANAYEAFRPNGKHDAPYYDEFAMFDDYYGSPHYADQMIRAALDGKSHEFDHQIFDFTVAASKDHHKGRAYFVEKAAAYLSVGMYVIRELNNALVHCENNTCGADSSSSDCPNNHALHSLDAAVALYTGAPQEDDGGATSSNFLFGLADEMCKLFRTCGDSGDSTSGTAKVNIDIFTEFDRLQQHLIDGKCWSAGKAKQHVVRLLYVPLFQGLIYSAFRKQTEAENYLEEEGVVFAAATMPRLADCSDHKAKLLHKNFIPGDVQGDDDFKAILSIVQDHYECLDLTCEEIGGIWHAEMQRYHEQAPPCTHTTSSSNSDSTGSSATSDNDESATTDADTAVDQAIISSDVDPRLVWIFVGVALSLIITAIFLHRTFTCHLRRSEKNPPNDGLVITNTPPYSEESKVTLSSCSSTSSPSDAGETDAVSATGELDDISDQIV